MAEPTPSVRSQWASGQYRNSARLPDGSAVTLVARAAGYNLTEPYGRMFVPGALSLLYDVLRYLRYKVQHRGAWRIDILGGDLTHGVLALGDDKVITTLSARNRKAAKGRVEELNLLLSSHGLEALPDRGAV